MHHFVADNAHMFEQIHSVERRQLETSAQLAEYQKSTDERFERVFDYMEAREEPKQKVFFEGQVYDAFDMDMMSSLFGEEFTAAQQEPALTFGVEQLEAMLAQAAREREFDASNPASVTAPDMSATITVSNRKAPYERRPLRHPSSARATNDPHLAATAPTW